MNRFDGLAMVGVPTDALPNNKNQENDRGGEIGSHARRRVNLLLRICSLLCEIWGVLFFSIWASMSIPPPASIFWGGV